MIIISLDTEQAPQSPVLPPFTEVQAAGFRAEGYLTAPHFFTPRETLALRAEVERLAREGFLRNVATAGDGKTPSDAQRNLQLCPMYRHSRLFRALPFHPKVLAAVTQLLGEPTLLHLDQVFLKPPGDGMGTNWHQDNAYFRITDPLMGTAMWIAVHDATVANGTLEVIPGVFREALPHERDAYSDHHIRCYPDEAQATPVELEAGGAVFFCYGTPHCTRANTTEQERAGVAFHFLRTDFAAADLKESGRDYRPHLTGPDATGGLAEYGEVVAGTWEAEVERTLARV
jgi:ectoine hydroxylase-related dioxygenase (phytanoyl-CoA dioxygenase family)